MAEIQMPRVGYLCEEVGRMAGLRKKTIYAHIKRGNIQVFYDELGNMKIESGEAYRWLYNRCNK
jgi:predicted site-specific integrase-resolvase